MAYIPEDLTIPARTGYAVTPSDATDLTNGIARSLYIGATGDVAVITLNGDTVTFVGAVAGSTIPIFVKRVLSTGTTATSIVALY